jgi:hypothetical protein
MQSMKTKYAVILVALIAAACSTPKPGTPEFVAKQEDDRQKAAVKSVEKTIENTPSWYLVKPSDANAIYETATAASPDPEMAMSIAIHEASIKLATAVGARFDSLIKTSSRQASVNNDPQFDQGVVKVTRAVVTEVELKGYVREKADLKQEGKNFRSWVLLRYPIGEANRLFMAEVKKNQVVESKVRTAEAWKELEREIDLRRNK